MLYTYKLIFQSYELLLIEAFCSNLNELFCKYTSIQNANSRRQNIKIKKKTVLSSPHVNKKAREQFETRVYSRTLNYTVHKDHNKTFLLIINTLLNNNSSNIHLKVEITSKFKN